MTTPITGPFTKTYNYIVPGPSGGTLIQRFQRTFRQKRKKPMLPLAYDLDDVRVLKCIDPTQPDYVGSVSVGPYPSWTEDWTVTAANKARAKLVEQLGANSLWAVNIAEAKKSLGLITGPVAGLISVTRKIRRFDFVGATREFNRLHESLRLRTRRNLRPVTVPKGLKETPKAFANNWLAFHFGWEPLIQDIGAAVETFTKPYPDKRIHGRGSEFDTQVLNTGGQFWHRTVYESTSHVRMGCTVRVINPNLFLAQQLGFVNPLSIAWELVPFSFVVDWFTNVGQVLGQMSEFAGVSVIDPYTTRYQVMDTKDTWYFGFYLAKRGVFLRRSLSLSGPTLRVRPWKGVSVVRGATAISLLVQLMGGKTSVR